MPDIRGTQCRACGAKIFFAPTEKSDSVPFDAAPTHIYGITETGKMKHQGKGHVCHFVTCPNRDQFTGNKPATPPQSPDPDITTVKVVASAPDDPPQAPPPPANPPTTVDRTPPVKPGKRKSPPARDYRDRNPDIGLVFPDEREEG